MSHRMQFRDAFFNRYLRADEQKFQAKRNDEHAMT